MSLQFWVHLLEMTHSENLKLMVHIIILLHLCLGFWVFEKKIWGFQKKFGVFEKKFGVFEKKFGVFVKNLGFSEYFWGFCEKNWGFCTRKHLCCHMEIFNTKTWF